MLSVFASLGSDPDRIARRAGGDTTLSPGEARKLALEDYPGCIVLVTHDDAFAEACTTSAIDVRRRRALELRHVR